MNQPTPEQIAKLPKWAQDHIEALERRLEGAEASLTSFLDEQKASPFFVDEWNQTPRRKRYISNAHNRICVEAFGIHAEVFIPYPGDGQRMQGLEVSWRKVEHFDSDGIAIVPRGHSSIQIVPKENL